MKIHRLLPIALIALAGLSLGSGCPTFPSLKDRIVELAAGGTTTLTFHGHSTTLTHTDDFGTYNLATGINLNSLLDDAGIDVSDVKDIALAGVSYRISVANAGARTISNGTVTVQRQGGSAVTLVSNFTQAVGSTTPFATAPLSAAGVTVLNTLLDDILTQVQAAKLDPNTPPVANPQVTYHVIGDADDIPYDFYWELKIDITVKGTVKITVLS